MDRGGRGRGVKNIYYWKEVLGGEESERTQVIHQY